MLKLFVKLSTYSFFRYKGKAHPQLWVMKPGKIDTYVFHRFLSQDYHARFRNRKGDIKARLYLRIEATFCTKLSYSFSQNFTQKLNAQSPIFVKPVFFLVYKAHYIHYSGDAVSRFTPNNLMSLLPRQWKTFTVVNESELFTANFYCVFLVLMSHVLYVIYNFPLPQNAQLTWVKKTFFAA